MRTLACAMMGLLVAAPGCNRTPNDGYALDVRLLVDSQVSNADVARITTVDIEIDGAESFSKTLPITGQLKSRSAGFRYRPTARAGTLTIAVTALDSTNLAIAGGRVVATLRAGATQLVSCDLGPLSSSAGPCVLAAIRCSGATPQHCDADGKWQDDAECPYTCVDGSCAGICKPGSTRCDGATVQTCDPEGQWASAASPCPILCSLGACVTHCAEGSTQCAAGELLQTCNGGKWNAGQPCPILCIDNQCGGVCAPPAQSCDATTNTPETCSAMGQWTPAPSPCAANLVCQNGACACPASPATQCSDDLTLVLGCSDGRWSPLTRCNPQFGCNKATGACRVCNSGDTRCNPDSSLEIQQCNADGQWVRSAACTMPGLSCIDQPTTGALRAACRECKHGDHRCANASRVQVCSDSTGKWSDEMSCPYGCNQAVTNDCNVACDPTTTTSTCVPPGVLKGCTPDGKLTQGQPCAGGACRNATSCKDCDDTRPQVRCSPTDSTVVQTCAPGGSWVQQAVCDPSTYPAGCDGGSCVVCKNGWVRCIVSDPAHPTGKTQLCQGNQWVDSGTYCGEGCSADNTACCVPTVGCQAGVCQHIDNDGCGRALDCAGTCIAGDDCYHGACVPSCDCGRLNNGACAECCDPTSGCHQDPKTMRCVCHCNPHFGC
jgi:hypothetical protein